MLKHACRFQCIFKTAGNSKWNNCKKCNSYTLYLFYWPLSEFNSISSYYRMRLPFIPTKRSQPIIFHKKWFHFFPLYLFLLLFWMLLQSTCTANKCEKKIPLRISELNWGKRQKCTHQQQKREQINIHAAVNRSIRSTNALFGFLLCHGKSNTVAKRVGALFSFPRFTHKHRIYFLLLASCNAKVQSIAQLYGVKLL